MKTKKSMDSEGKRQPGGGIFIHEWFVFMRLTERVLIRSMEEDMGLLVHVDDEILIVWDKN